MTQQAQAEALLPCPFCGSAAHFDIDDDNWEWVECESCGMQGNRSASLMEDCKPKLREAWNRRAPAQLATFTNELATLPPELATQQAVQLPEPVAYSLGLAKYAHSSNIIAANEFTPDAEHADEWENLYTEQQVRAMVAAQAAPVCPFPCGWENLHKLAVAEGAYIARCLQQDDPVTDNLRDTVMRVVNYSIQTARAMLAAAPTPPAQERKPLGPHGVQKLIIKMNAEHGDNWNHGDLVRAAEIHHGIGATNAD